MKSKNVINIINKIVEAKSANELHGVTVDLFTASAIQALYNSLNEKNKESLEWRISKGSDELISVAHLAFEIKAKL